MPCDCCADGGTTPESTLDDATDRTAPLAARTPLPAHVADALATALDHDDVDTLDDWVAALPAVFPEWPPAVPDLCHDPDGRHRATTPDDAFRLVCVLDALLLPHLLDAPVTVESSAPAGDDVTLELGPDGDADAPAGAVVSFGAVPAAPDGDPTAEHAVATVCPAIHAFSSLAAYEAWDAETEAATTPLSVERATALAARMVAAGDD